MKHDLDPVLLDDISNLIVQAPNGPAIWLQCVNIAQLLLTKNLSYGDSALNPIRVFSTATPTEQIRVRIDDKLSRLAAWSGEEDAPIPEDTILDLVGYLILLRIAQGDAR